MTGISHDAQADASQPAGQAGSMNDHPRVSVADGTAFVLDRKAVLSAVAGLCAHDRAAAGKLCRELDRFLAAGQWPGQLARLDRTGLTGRHAPGPLRDALAIPGNLILLRGGDNRFALLYRIERRWQFIAGDGIPLPGDVAADDGSAVDALVLTVPGPGTSPGSFASLAALWPELRTAWAEVGAASFFVNAGQLLLPLFAMLIYDKIALNGLFETLWALVFGMALYLATDTGMRLVRSWATERISIDLTLRSDETLWSKLVAQVDLPPGGFPRFLSNYRDLTLSRDFVSSIYLLSIADIPFLLLYLVVIGIISWPLMIIVILLALAYCVTGLWMQNRQNLLSREAEGHNTRKLAFMGEALGCLDVVRTTPGAGAFLRRWRELTELSANCDRDRRLAFQQTGMLSMLMQTVTSIVMLTAGVYLIHAQVLSVGKLIACNLLAGRGMALVASFFAVTGKWQDFVRAAARMEASLEPVADRECTPRASISGQMTVLGLGKHYEGRPAALDGISLTIAPGERIALMGRPGAGKSTLLQCLAGLCRPDAGQILFDGLALDDIARFDRVRWLAYKAQDPVVFAGTLEENLRISGCTDQERFAAALWASGLESEFSSGRMSLGMQLTERGSNLSGGQRQKVALARALAQPSRVLLLDEPSLGLDPESERLLAERLPKLLDSASVLVVSTHSAILLETVRRVVALDSGRVVADGPREKLVKLS